MVLFSPKLRPDDHLWDPLRTDASLHGDDIHVWCASIAQWRSQFKRFAAMLSSDEWKRARRFYFEEDRRRFIVSRGLLRAILSSYLGIEPSRLQFCYGPHGKPALSETSGGPTLRFNLSHSQGLVLYAFTNDREIGVDLECVRPIPDAEQIVEQFFTAQENAVFRSLPQNRRLEGFFKFWTRKEACVKATGDGLARPLDRLDVSSAVWETTMVLNIGGNHEEPSRWHLRDLIPAIGYVAAIAIQEYTGVSHAGSGSHGNVHSELSDS